MTTTTRKEVLLKLKTKLEALEPKKLIGHTYVTSLNGEECYCAVGVYISPEDITKLKTKKDGFYLEEPIDSLVKYQEILDYEDNEVDVLREVQRINDGCSTSGCPAETPEERYKRVLHYVDCALVALD